LAEGFFSSVAVAFSCEAGIVNGFPQLGQATVWPAK
jgi:hypothetical protein